jgi:Bacteriocin-protection, YdeI or OmpD-Associated/Domain of unknown function (DUF1905)
MRFRTTILSAGKNAAGILVPDEVVEGLGSGKRPPVRVTIKGHTYRSSVAVMGGVFMVGVSGENREAAGIRGGDEVDVDIVLDTEPRQVAVPSDLGAELDKDAAAKRYFESLSYSNKRRIVEPIASARTAETRERRIAKAVRSLHDGRIQ